MARSRKEGWTIATTRLMKRKTTPGLSIAQSIKDCTDYGKNPVKTEEGKYISAYECDPATVDAEFLLWKSRYKAATGREQKTDKDVLCYQIRQSFLPGEIAPEDANRIGYELAMRWTKGKHQFIVTTHTDKAHIHNHIYYNSTTLDCTHKYRDFLGSGRALGRLSDTLCLENGLSVVKQPKMKSQGKYKNYGEWAKGRERPLTFQQKLCAAIDAALEKQPSGLAAFLSLMEQSGYEVKQQRGAISFRAPGQERFTRLRSSALGNGPGYERWAKVFNLKQMAAALAFLQENNLMEYEQLEKKAAETTEHFHTLSGQIKSTEAALQTNRELKAATVQYARPRPVFQAYKARKYSRRFLAEHEADIELYRAACADFKRILDGAKPPKMDELKEESRELVEKKKKLYAEYRKVKEEMREVTAAKANIDYLLGYAEPGRKKEQER